MKIKIVDIIIVLLAVVLVVSGYKLWQGLSEYRRGEQEYEQTANTFIQTQGSRPSGSGGGTAEEEAGISCPISVDFEGLAAENPDVVGWIYSENTPINYPVVRGSNNDKYLYTTFYGQHNSSGSIFMDYRCDGNLAGLNTIIYGHHMKNGAMFASLRKYRSQEYYDEHPVMWYLTPSAVYRLDVLAGYVDDAEADVYEMFYEKEQLLSYLNYARSRSNFTPAEEIASLSSEEIPRVVVLSTCSYEYDDARYIVAGIPVPVE